MTAALFTGLLTVLEGMLCIVWGRLVLHLHMEQLRTLTLLMLVFTSQLNVLMVRERRSMWASQPGRALSVSAALVTIAYVALGISGYLVPALPLAVILEMLAFLACCTALIDIPKRFIWVITAWA